MERAFSAKLTDVIPVANTLGESILWDHRHERLWWTDIQERYLYRYAPMTRNLERFSVPERLGSFGLVEGSENLIAAFESGFALYHPETRWLDWLERPPHEICNMRFNDGRVDRAGRFWAGSMVEGYGESRGKLYSLQNGRITTHMSDLGICNSLCFSPQGRQMYVADTPQRCIWRFDLLEPHGTLSNRQVFVKTPEGSYPDGSNVDVEGNVWNAHWGGGCVVCYAPNGREIYRIRLPVSQPTCVAFGGERMDVLFVTSARQGLSTEALSKQPQAGSVFSYQLEISGLREPRYKP